MTFSRILVIVLDSVGIGALPDASQYGDEGAHTLGHIAETRKGKLALPHLEQLGLGRIEPIVGIKAVEQPRAFYGKMAEVSAGKDTMTGHWELMGLKIDTPFRTFPNGFPRELLQRFEERTGRKTIGNKPASGTEIIAELGPTQMKTGEWIVYTSADSVFQIAAHEDVIPLEELYAACEIARELTKEGEYAVGRVIARPYVGEPGNFTRTENRKDYALKPPEPTVMNALSEAGYDCIAIGKINDIFSGEGITEAVPTKNNLDGVDKIVATMQKPFRGLAFANLVDFDSLYGHRRDVEGYAAALEQFDQNVPRILGVAREDDLVIITADHGNDPTHHGTDHTREYVPLLAWSPRFEKGDNLGVRSTFADVAATIADNFGVTRPANGSSFLPQISER